ncbi:AAA family ATPase [Ureaplasma canigenitalium]|uniref:AAA family ATPase n=1 Tax=Ureaplasma canigenitalium TaxID=42092 RepID=UPI0004E1DC83|nr:AAA family ATPase [Ureaplasma canigenitalium]
MEQIKTLTDLINVLKKPTKIDDIFGQEHLLDEKGLIKRMINQKIVFNLIFYGQPGVGKSSLARVLANELGYHYGFFNPVIDSKQKLIELITESKSYDNFILIIDEIHRLNRDKQDILLPVLEMNEIKVFVTTTENPYFVINPALRSRCQILNVTSTPGEIICQKLKKMFDFNEFIEPQALRMLTDKTNGDLRQIIATLEIINLLYTDTRVDLKLLNSIMQQNYTLGSYDGDEIHNLKSAFHKSMRGSDVDASLYYLMRLISIGDFDAIYRRILVCVSEDIGLANPGMLSRVHSAIETAKYLGFPENQVVLCNIVAQIALSDKSNSIYLAMNEIKNDLTYGKSYEIPMHIRDSHYKSAKKLGVEGYFYPHDFKNNYVNQRYLPVGLKDKKYYQLQNNQNEQKLWFNLMRRIEQKDK